MKCIVHGCENRLDQGAFVGSLCAPCHHMLTTGRVGCGATFVHWLDALAEAAVLFRSSASSLPEFCEAVDAFMHVTEREWPSLLCGIAAEGKART